VDIAAEGVQELWDCGTKLIDGIVFCAVFKNDENMPLKRLFSISQTDKLEESDLINQRSSIPRQMVSLIFYVMARGYAPPLNGEPTVGNFVHTLLSIGKETKEADFGKLLYSFNPEHLNTAFKELVTDLDIVSNMHEVVKNRICLTPNGHKSLIAAKKLNKDPRDSGDVSSFYSVLREKAGELAKNEFYPSLHNLVQVVQKHCSFFAKNAMYALVHGCGTDSDENLKVLQSMPAFANEVFIHGNKTGGIPEVMSFTHEIDANYIATFSKAIGSKATISMV
jgi:hypothetical protein